MVGDPYRNVETPYEDGPLVGQSVVFNWVFFRTPDGKTLDELKGRQAWHYTDKPMYAHIWRDGEGVYIYRQEDK